MPHHASLRNTYLALAGCLALGVAGLTAPVPAWGQASGMGGIGSSQTITARAKVQAIDLDKVKVGDTVVTTYYASTVLVLSAPGTEVPDNQVKTAMARAAKGQMPAGALGTKMVVTGTVVSVDLAHHTISLVNPSGGMVRSTLPIPSGRRR